MLRLRSTYRRAARDAALAAALLAFPPVPCLAIHSGHVQGHVLDENARPVEGALVTISGPDAVGIWRCRTDAQGFYRIAGLEAGKDLTIRVEAEERAVVQRTGYRLRDDQTLRLGFRLRPKGVYSTLVIIDPRVPYHRTALAGARETLPPGVRIFEASEISPKLTRRLFRALAAHPDGVLTIGSLPARLARESIFDVPVVYTMVLDPDKENLRAINMCGVPANGAFSEQLDILERLAPAAKRVGLLFDPSRADGVVRQLREEAVQAGFSVEALSVYDPAEVPQRLAELAGAGIDAFMVLLDPGLYTTPVFQQVRAFSQEHGVILIVPDSAMVRAGATFSYGPGFQELGAYAGRLMGNLLRREVTVGEIGVIYPRTRYFSLNPQDVDRFQLQLPPDLIPAPAGLDTPRILLQPGG